MAWTNATLTAAIIATTQNDETTFVANIPVFILMAEDRINSEVQLPAYMRNVTGTLTASNQYLQAPTDFLAPLSLSVFVTNATTFLVEQHYLLDKDVSFIREIYPPAATTGEPLYYALFDDNTFILGPTPDLPYASELHYYYQPPSITTAGTSWLGDRAPSCLLYAALVEAYIFMKGDTDVLEMYQSRYQEALLRLKNLGENKDRSDQFRNNAMPRGPVT